MGGGGDWQKKQVDLIVIFIAIKKTQMYRKLVFNTCEIARCFLEGLMTYFVFAFLWLIFLWEYIYNLVYFSFFFFIKSYLVILKATDPAQFCF